MFYKFNLRIISILITFIIGIFFICFTFYVHEFGHIIFGTLSNIIRHRTLSIPYFSNWKKCLFFLIPQQTTIDLEATLLFAMGGIFSSIILILFIYFVYKKIDGPKIYFKLFLITFMLTEIISNFVCGTDNFLGRPFLNCANLIKFRILFIIISIISFTLMFYPFFEKIILKINQLLFRFFIKFDFKIKKYRKYIMINIKNISSSFL
ncbi:MAG: hypothetical protein QXS37_05560 [Candidatus Aenigmatarchaeota archaeon]